MKTTHRTITLLTAFALTSLLCSSCSNQVSSKLHTPIKTPSDISSTKEATTWSRVKFGSYPSKEIVPSTWKSVDEYALLDGDIIKDDALYQSLRQSNWNNEALTLNGVSYIREKSNPKKNSEQHYLLDDQYHYFALEPLKWRIIAQNGQKWTLLSDRAIDCLPFHDADESVSWSTSSLRKWLNDDKGGFYGKAFSQEEKQLIITVANENKPCPTYRSSSGPNTDDKVYILSNNEVFASEIGNEYGFYAGHGYDDSAKRFTSTTYAKFHGAWWSPVAPYKGNSFWFMRTSGYTSSNVTYICDFGYIYERGTSVICNDAGIVPVINIEVDPSYFKDVDEKSSLEIIKPSGGEEKENTCEIDGEKKDHPIIEFGEYPQSEVLPVSPNDGIDGAIVDKELYEMLQAQDWTKEVIIDNVAYETIDDHYFAVEPIKWKVLEEKDGTSLLFPVRGLDCIPYHDDLKNVNWKDSKIRQWLNHDFYEKAFANVSSKVQESNVENNDNFYFGTTCGDDTNDKVFLLSEEEVFCSKKASDYGFACSDADADPARIHKPTRYALAKGAWISPTDKNGFWMLRTNGYNQSNAVYVSDDGNIYNRGIPVTCKDAIVMPSLRIK